ncbi:MAG: class I SAM-dependent methyltransferase [Bacteroidales bacterium]|jgi:predicted O-methyltransferase YrrM|nr:class I SAM-dependent methyltransferase [Bacteroidales bacterium]
MDKINNDVENYINEFGTSENDLLEKLTRETAITQIHPRMLSGKYQGNLLGFIIKITGASNILEIGTYAGYSAICMAMALPENGTIITIEKNDEIEWLSHKYFNLSGLGNKIKSVTGDALNIIPNLNEEFDIVFIDGDKREYSEYYSIVFPKVKKGGIILADNVLWNNKIFSDPVSNDYMTKGIIEFNEKIRTDPRVEKIILPVRDGLMAIRKL